jgi:signal transduction histidine kinase
MILKLTPDSVGLEHGANSVATVPEIRFIANPSAVEQILFNLVDNACKYARPTNDPTIKIQASIEKGHTCIRVTDHGPGIGSDVRKRLFQPFSKSASDAAKSEPGVGLGLSLCKRLAQNMKGELRLVSSTDTGTVFELRLRRSE